MRQVVLHAIAAVAAMASLIGAATGCKSGGSDNGNNGKEQTVPNVRTAAAQSIGSTRTVTYPGRIQPAKDVNLSFRVAGPVAAVHFREGQHVRQGDTLAEIEERDYAIQLAATTAQYEQVKAEAGRVIELSDRGSATQNDYDKARYGLEQITALYHAHQNALNDTKMLAPIVKVDIPVDDFVNIDKAARSWCTVDVYPGKTFELRLIDITKKANLNQLFTARYALRPASDGTMPHSGISTGVCIEYRTDEEGTVSIPATALFEDRGETCVWAVGPDNTIQRRAVTADDIDRDGNARIISGLKAGETVVTAGVNSLKDGARVKVLPGKSATNPGNLL